MPLNFLLIQDLYFCVCVSILLMYFFPFVFFNLFNLLI